MAKQRGQNRSRGGPGSSQQDWCSAAGSGVIFNRMPASNGACNRIVPYRLVSYGNGAWSRPIEVRDLD
jgi:hypothetical protein